MVAKFHQINQVYHYLTDPLNKTYLENIINEQHKKRNKHHFFEKGSKKKREEEISLEEKNDLCLMELIYLLLM